MQHHTKGQWFIDERAGYMAIYIGTEAADGTGRIVASKTIAKINPHQPVHYQDKRRSMSWAHDAEDKANALLIAAAPDMLNMLEFVLASGNCELDHETALLIQNTINKAKGE